MTNGEKFKEIFQISQVDDCDLNVYGWLPIHDAIEISMDWWNAEYNEPTTKNDLGVLDRVRAEIETKYGQCNICEYFEDYDYEENDISEYRPIGDIADILQIIDKYKTESEDKE